MGCRHGHPVQDFADRALWTDSEMKKSTFKNLERLFAREILGMMFQPANQKKIPKWLSDFVKCELVYPVQEKFGPVVCNGFRLTHKGREAYCAACPPIVDE